ncbi:hypothetical protein [Empedobacter tilapiae]|uniref:hypothetical protein n=1 Tax=Empedobacter tilapiae TaxID=2491114 RepID=UPI001456BB20|nr:hypothetical protein [Empedobacter tilapiae]
MNGDMVSIQLIFPEYLEAVDESIENLLLSDTNEVIVHDMENMKQQHLKLLTKFNYFL